MCFPSQPKDNSAALAKQAEKKRQRLITEGTQSIDHAFAGFNPEFFGARESAYQNYAAPQLDDQYAEAKRQLAYALERKGLSASTAAADQQRKLGEQYAKYRTDIVNNGKSFAQKSQGDIENARSTLLSQLTATEDPAAVSAQALRLAQEKSAPPTFDPLGAFVFNISQGLANQNAAQGYGGLVKSPLFQGAGGSVSYSS